jgi:ubiquinone/menaquinone biosynthesis C-methylase UbiE
MNNPTQIFQHILLNTAALPFDQQESVCNAFQFLLEDYIKKFPAASIKTYQILFTALRDIADFYTEGKKVLEIGPGSNLGVLFLSALGGASKATGVDFYSHNMGPEHDFIMSMYMQLLKEPGVPIIRENPWNANLLSDKLASIITKDTTGKFNFKKERLEFIFPCTAEQLPVEDNSIDLVYTSAAFEHFLNPEEVVKELSRITSKGGLNCHAIDMRDHRDFSKPLEFLKFSEAQWQEINCKAPGYSHTNRMRHNQIISLFNSAGFRLLGVKPLISCRADHEMLSQFAEPYRSMPDHELFTLVEIFIFKKEVDT